MMTNDLQKQNSINPTYNIKGGLKNILKILFINIGIIMVGFYISEKVIIRFIHHYGYNHMFAGGVILFAFTISSIVIIKSLKGVKKYKLLKILSALLLNLIAAIILSGPLSFLLPPLYKVSPTGVRHFIGMSLLAIYINFWGVIAFLAFIGYKIIEFIGMVK